MPERLKPVGDWLSKVAQPLVWSAVAIWGVLSGVSGALSYIDSQESRITRLEQFQEAAGASIRSIETISENVRRLDGSVKDQAVLIRELTIQTSRIAGQLESITDQINRRDR